MILRQDVNESTVAERSPACGDELTVNAVPILAGNINRDRAVVVAVRIRLQVADERVSAVRRGDRV